MTYCTTDDVVKVVTNIESWCSTLHDKVSEATVEIDKYLRNARNFTTEQIAALTDQSIADLKMSAIYWTLFLAYNDASEGAAGGYADKAVDYRNWFDREIKSVNVESTVTSEYSSGQSFGQGDITL